MYLSGTGTDNAVEWDFYCTGGRNSETWTKIPVPSNWELEGFGEYNYGHDENKASEKGLYRYSFHVPEEWKKRDVKIVFVASMTDTEVKINGKSAGPVHQGGFYQFQHEVSDLLKYGKENLLEVKVSKMSSIESVNMAERKADYWIFGGIFRPVYLKASPREHIERIAVNAKADGSIEVEVYPEGLKKDGEISLYLTDLSGNKLEGMPTTMVSKDSKKTLIQGKYDNIKTWNPEHPNLYYVVLELRRNDEIIHRYRERIGFRTIEIKKRDGIYVNGRKIMFRGVCRHSFWPSSGRALNKSLSIKDVELMKDMNMNAVRMSHYPPDPHFLDVCDSLGLFVLDEMAGWQRPPYDTEIGKKLVKELVIRDVNHPSIVLWDNGNEGGWNNDLNDEFAKYDPQNRAVIHPWELFNGMDTKHYRDWNYGAQTFFNGRDIFFPTEFLHGLYDGGHGAGLEDWWNLMLNRPLSAGGFLWVFADEGVVRTDLDGWIDTKKNNAPDGIVGPYREKEGSYYTIKEIWSPVHISLEFLPPGFDGSILVENRFFFTNIKDCSFKAILYDFNRRNNEENADLSIIVPDIKTGNQGEIKIELPENWRKNNDILELTVFDPHGKEIMTWTWPVKTPGEFCSEIMDISLTGKSQIMETEGQILMKNEKITVYVSKSTGLMDSLEFKDKNPGLANGRVFTNTDPELDKIDFISENGMAEVSVYFNEGSSYIKYKLNGTGWFEIEYEYRLKGKLEYAGVSFNFPESHIKKVNMLADGPYRVYKNRMKGPQFGYWEKEYNNTVTGESWDYPEFKGYYSNFYYAEFITDNDPFYVCTENEDIFLRLFTPEYPDGAYNTNTDPVFPQGDISFMDAISPIGTKFKKPEQIGPMGEKNMLDRWQDDKNIKRRLYFYFGVREW